MYAWCSSRPFSSTRTISRGVHGTEFAWPDGVDGSNLCAGDLRTAPNRWGGPAGTLGPARGLRASTLNLVDKLWTNVDKRGQMVTTAWRKAA